ncbi:DUF305 domain-containing protein [Solicola sp. PLA-1-18]|uniref:DUF305 domain-containing protein n=1 Tax=Solicola sp. PLA-1-18 TaxID=3380532 RepID=UPI003B7D2579
MVLQCRAPRAVLALASVLLLAGTTACSSSEDDASGGVDVIVPGEPGEDATTVAPEKVEGAADDFNDDDVEFVQMMVPHHGQALTMTAMAATHASDAGVKRLASRIEAAQRPEILQMSAWLKSRRVEVPSAGDHGSAHDHGAHGHGEMMGMLTDDQLAELDAARGAAFDRLFLEGMIRHHEGAVAMADDVATGGVDVRVAELAADVNTGQLVEIRRMKDMLAAL